MCGIIGYAGFREKVLLRSAVEAIKHRGPDGNDVYYFDGVALGSTRLSIIDVSTKGDQPMFTADKSLCIVFNGEIYNYRSLKKELASKYKFRSASDTEVMLYAYKEWGYKCVERLSGMFSFVIYDRNRDLLFGARDRCGQKPLKYYLNQGKFIFGSEIKAILKLVDSKPVVDEVAIDDFLTFGYVPSPRTGFKNIYKLPPAHYFVYKAGKFSKHKYWSLDFNKKLHMSEDEWIDTIYDGLETAVKSHLVSDVPVGALLSGGLDSSIITALMCKNYGKKVNTFSIGFDEADFDESYYAKEVAKKYNTKHRDLKVSAKDLLLNLDKLAYSYDEPIGDNSILPTFLVSKLASSYLKVALCGDGGDENFAGYDRYNIVNTASLLSRAPEVLKDSLAFAANTAHKISATKTTERVSRFMGTSKDKFYRKYVNYNCFFTNEAKQALYSDNFKQEIGRNDSFQAFKSLYDGKLSDLDNALHIDIQTYLPDDLLYKTDTASMAFGLELRAPFLDSEFMQKMASMPNDLKLKNGVKKWILKKMAIKYDLIPEEFITRKKHGFTIPQNIWFKGVLKNYLYETILSSSMMSEVFDQIKLKKYLDNYYKTSLAYDNNIFALLMLALWFKNYF